MPRSKKITNRFPAALEKVRRAVGMKGEDFELISSRRHITRLETGRMSPTLRKVDDLADTLGVHPLTLIALAYMDVEGAPSVLPGLEQVVQELEAIAESSLASRDG